MSQDCCSICLEPLIHHSQEAAEPIGAASCGHCMHLMCFSRYKEGRVLNFYETEHQPSPCPVCTKPVFEFIRLYISGDRSENERLKQDIKKLKRKLAYERILLKKARDMLTTASLAPPTETTTLVRNSSTQRLSSRHRERNNQNASVVSPTGADSGTYTNNKYSNNIANESSQACLSRYRRHESCPLYFDCNDRPVETRVSGTSNDTRRHHNSNTATPNYSNSRSENNYSNNRTYNATTANSNRTSTSSNINHNNNGGTDDPPERSLNMLAMALFPTVSSWPGVSVDEPSTSSTVKGQEPEASVPPPPAVELRPDPPSPPSGTWRGDDESYSSEDLSTWMQRMALVVTTPFAASTASLPLRPPRHDPPCGGE